MKIVFVADKGVAESAPHEWAHADRVRGTDARTDLGDVTPLEYEELKFLGQMQSHRHDGRNYSGYCVGLNDMGDAKLVGLILCNKKKIWIVPKKTVTAPFQTGARGLKRLDQELSSSFADEPRLSHSDFKHLRRSVIKSLAKVPQSDAANRAA